MQKTILLFALMFISVHLFSQSEPIIYYPLDQSPDINNTIEDVTGNTQGTLTNTNNGIPQAANGAVPYSLGAWDFSANESSISTNYNDVTASLGDISVTSGITVGFWIKYNYDFAHDFTRICGIQTPIDIMVRRSSGIGVIEFRYGSYTIGTVAADDVLDGNWHHIVATLDFGSSTDNHKVYIDGVLKHTKSQTVSSSFSSPNKSLRIGARHSGDRPFSGILDDFAIFDRAVSSDEAAQLHQQGGASFFQTKALLFYPFDQAPVEGNAAVNDITNNTQASLNNTSDGLPQQTSGAESYSSSAWDFSANDAHAYIDPNDKTALLGDISQTSGITVGFWIKYNYDFAHDFTRICGIQTPVDIMVRRSGGIGIIEFRYGSHTIQTSYVDNILEGEWHHVVATLDFGSGTDNHKVYIDGVLKHTKSQAITGSFNSPNKPFRIGARHSGDRPFSGTLDEFIVFDKSITADQVTQLYQEGGYVFTDTPTPQPPISNAKQAVMFYPLDQTPNTNEVVTDVTGNTEGSLYNTTAGIPQQTNGAANYSPMSWDFSANDSHVYVEANEATETLGNITETSGLTVGFWVKYNYDFAHDFSRICGLQTPIDIMARRSSGIGVIEVRYGSHSIATSFADNILEGNWHHIVTTLDFNSTTDNYKVYIDGVLKHIKSETVSSSFNSPNKPFRFGARHSGDRPFNGSLDELIIFDQAITQEDVTQLFEEGGYAFANGTVPDVPDVTIVPSPPAGTIILDEPIQNKMANMFYPLDQVPETVPGAIIDLTTNTIGTLDKTNTGLPELISGARSFSTNAWDFSQNDSHIMTNNSEKLDVIGDIENSSGLTVGFWIKYNYDPADTYLRICGLSIPIDVLIGSTGGNGILEFRFNDSKHKIIAGTNTLDGNWHHVVATFDFKNSTDNLKVYVDGEEYGSNSSPVAYSFATSSNRFRIGARYSGGNQFRGALDEMIVFDRAISDTEVETLYEYGGTIFSQNIVNVGKDTFLSKGVTSLPINPVIQHNKFLNSGANFTYTWEQLTGPQGVTFSPANTANTTLSFPYVGTYTLQLSVSDGIFEAKDQIVVEVQNNMPPVIDEINPLFPTFDGNSNSSQTTVNATVNDPDNYPSALNYSWSKIEGPGSVNFANASALNTSVTFSAIGNYKLQLAASDGNETTVAVIDVTVSPQTKAGGFDYGWLAYDHPVDFGQINLNLSTSDLVSVSHVPAAGIHPRIYFGPDEIPTLKQRMNNTDSGREAMAQVHAYTTLLHLGFPGNGTYSHFTNYGKDAMGNKRIDNGGSWDYSTEYQNLVAEKSDALDGMDTKNRSKLASLMALVAYECLIREGETNTDLGRTYASIGQDLAKAMNHWATIAAADPTVDMHDYNRFGGVNMALCYDLHFNSMTTAQQDIVRKALAKIVSKKPIYGSDVKPNAMTSNWVGLNSFEIITNWAIEWEEGYNHNLTHEYMRTYKNFLNYGWHVDGTPFEGLGKNYIFVATLTAAAKRGYTLLGHPAMRAFGTDFLTAITQPYGGSFIGTDVWGGTGYDAEMGGYRFHPNDIVGLKWIYPNDPKIDFAWENYVSRSTSFTEDDGIYFYQYFVPTSNGYHNHLIPAAVYAKDYNTGSNFTSKNTTALSNKLSFYAKDRGMAVMRSGFDENAAMTHFHCRQDIGGHTNGDRNNFTLSALGRIWVPYSYGRKLQETKFHSCILVDGKGIKLNNKDGIKATQPGRVLMHEDNAQMAQITGDATYAYTYEWDWRFLYEDENDPRLTGGWEKVTKTWNDFLPESKPTTLTHYHTDYYDVDSWANGKISRYIQKEYNSMEKVLRNVTMVKGSNPFLLITDDIKKDNNNHVFKWVMQIANDLSIESHSVDYNNNNYRRDVILKEASGDRRLLVRVLQNEGYTGNAAPLAIGQHSDNGITYKHLYMDVNVVEPKFKVMLFPHNQGDALPITKWTNDRTVLTVEFENEVKTIAFNTESESGKPDYPKIQITTSSNKKEIGQTLIKGLSLEVSPMPFSQDFSMNIKTEQNENLTVKIHNVQGKIIYDNKLELTTGSNYIQMDSKDWNSGMYYIQIINETGQIRAVQQVVKH